MVEYRQRLRVMLSASRGKYHLQKSSGRIGENIKYIYYFTYFHEYTTHPFWDVFNKEFKVDIEAIIKDKVEGLEKSIVKLGRSYSLLLLNLESVQMYLSHLQTSIDYVELIATANIDKSLYNIENHMRTNQSNMKKTIDNIDSRIKSIFENIKLYINVELTGIINELLIQNYTIRLKILLLKLILRYVNGKLTSLKGKVDEIFGPINCQDYQSYIEYISNSVYRQRIGQITEKVTVETSVTNFTTQSIFGSSIQTSSTTNIYSEERSNHHRLETLCVVKEVQKELKKLFEELTQLINSTNQKLEEALKYTKEFDDYINLNKVNRNYSKSIDLFNGDINFLENLINWLDQDYLKKLKDNHIIKINADFVKINSQIQILKKLVEAFKGFYGFRNESISKQIQELKSILKEERVDSPFNTLLYKINEQICNLENQSKLYSKQLGIMTEVLKTTKELRDSNLKLKGHKDKLVLGSKLQLYITKIDNMTSSAKGEEEIEKITKGGPSKYFDEISRMRVCVTKVLGVLGNKELPNQNELQTSRENLKKVYCQLTDLEFFGNNINNLTHVMLAIKQLKDFQKKIQGLDDHKKKLEPFIETMKPYLKTLKGIESNIGEINTVKDKLPKLSDIGKLPTLQDMPNKLQTIKDKYTSIVKLNLGIEDLKGNEFLQSLLEVAGVQGPGGSGGVGGGNAGNAGSLLSVLEQIQNKLSEPVEEYSKQITERFKQKVKAILEQCSTRLKRIEVPSVEKCFYVNITTCVSYVNILIPISNIPRCKQLDDLKLICLRDSLKELETCIKCVTSLCKPDKVCDCTTEALSAINSRCDTDEILEAFTKCIKELEKKKKQIEEKKDEILVKKEEISKSLKEAKDVLLTLSRFTGRPNFAVMCLEHNLDKVTDELVPFLDKVGNVICRMEKEIDYLKQQLQTTSQEVTILNGFKFTVDEEIRNMEGNIEGIRQAGTEIPKKHQEYSKSFSSFKEKLEQLETWLDYRIVQFLRCSLCTTICNLKRHIESSYCNCPNTKT